MINTKGIALLSAAALLGPAAAIAAESLPWTYVEFGYNRTDGSEIPDCNGCKTDTDAYNLSGSVGFLGKWHAQLDYVDGETDTDFSEDPDFDGYRLVVGAHPQLTDKTQLVTNITYFDYDGGEGSFEAEVSGYGVGLGLRHALTPKFEASLLTWYVEGDTDFSDSFFSESADFNETIIELQGRYNWTQNLSVGLTASIGGAFNTIGSASSWGGLLNGSGANDGEKQSLGEGGETIRFDVRWSFGNNDLSDL